ncbi:MAG: thioredoxin family protein [Candidatus Brocadiia bacterium]
MGKTARIAIVLVVAGVVAAVVALKAQQNGGGGDRPADSAGPRGSAQEGAETPGTGQPNADVPRLVDLGSAQCIPCKMMAPILEELKTDYADRFETVFIDVRENRAAARRYDIRVIPTQIFLGPSGEELFRHEGFYSKEDILTKWKELGFDMTKGNGNADTS